MKTLANRSSDTLSFFPHRTDIDSIGCYMCRVIQLMCNDSSEFKLLQLRRDVIGDRET